MYNNSLAKERERGSEIIYIFILYIFWGLRLENVHMECPFPRRSGWSLCKNYDTSIQELQWTPQGQKNQVPDRYTAAAIQKVGIGYLLFLIVHPWKSGFYS